MSSEIAIKVENLSKCYQIYDQPRDRLKQFVMPRIRHLAGLPPKRYCREFRSLNDVSFTVKKGETVGIIGRNGSGKSTLLQMICGTLSPTSGRIVTSGRIAALLELGAGFNSEFTGRENVYMNASVLGMSKNEIDARFDEIAAFADIGDFIEQPVKTYSSGMYARLAFSTAINVDPEILIVDEALAVGDTRFVAKCMRRIKDIQEQGVSILFVSHDIGSVRALCQRVIWLDKGCLVEQGDVFPVTGRFAEFMFGDEKSERDALHAAIATPLKNLLSQENDSIEMANLSSGSANEISATASQLFSFDELPSIKETPVTHWGSNKGVIVKAGICDEEGVRKCVFIWGKEIHIFVEVNLPKEISRDHLSIAFSIKDLKGIDLIVSTTHDSEHKRLPEKERFRVFFKFINPLVTGKYLLVVAVENRRYRDIHYYEYIEGAQYFSSHSNQRFFGLFQPSISQQVSE